jgi:hypothetical protein
VNDYLRSAKPGDELKRLYSLRQELKQREADAAETIKNTVFDHYKHFIDTSREVSSEKGEGNCLASSAFFVQILNVKYTSCRRC